MRGPWTARPEEITDLLTRLAAARSECRALLDDVDQRRRFSRTVALEAEHDQLTAEIDSLTVEIDQVLTELHALIPRQRSADG